MRKSILFALMAITVTMLCTEDAFARCRQRCRCRSRACCAAPACNTCNSCNSCSTWNGGSACNSCGTSGCSACTAAPMTASMVAGNVTAPVAVAQSNSTSNYQSYSYEPGSSQPMNTVATSAPVYSPRTVQYGTTRRAWNEFDSVLNGNRKAMGHRAMGE